MSLPNGCTPPTPSEENDIHAALHVEGELTRLERSNAVHWQQLDRKRGECRKRAYDMLTPNARKLLEVSLRELGVLKVDLQPGDPNWNLLGFSGGAAA